MPAAYQGTLFRSQGNPLLDLATPAGVSPRTQRSSLDLLRELNAFPFECETTIPNCNTLAEWARQQNEPTGGTKLAGFARAADVSGIQARIQIEWIAVQ